MTNSLNTTKDASVWHVIRFSMIHDQNRGSQKLRDSGVTFENFPMGITVVADWEESQFNEFIEEYQKELDEGRDSSIVDLYDTEDIKVVEKLINPFSHDEELGL